MTRRVDRERPILGTEPKLVARGGEGREWGSVSKTGPHGAMEGPKKRLKRPGTRVGCDGKDAENGSQSRSFLPPFHRYIDTYGLLGGHREWLQIFDIKTMLTLLTGAKSRSFLLNTSTAVSSAFTTFLHSIHLHSYLLHLYGLPPLNAPPAAQLRLI
jgi:hypothetical protein